MASLINKAIADKMVGQPHGSGTFVRWEDRGATTVMISKCGNPTCGAERAVSLQNAAQAVQNPTIPVIACTMYCKTVASTPKAQSLEEILAIPEARRTSAQQKVVVEAEFAANATAAQAVKDAPLVAARARLSVATNREIFVQHERLLQAIVIAVHGVSWTGGNEGPEICKHPSYVPFSVWKTLSDDERAVLNDVVDRQLASVGQSNCMRS